MKNTLKRIARWTGIVLALLLILMILLPFIFKKQILQAVKDEINKNVNARVEFADYGLNLFRSFPDFSLSLHEVSVVGINEFNNDTLASVKKLSVSLNLFSVIGGDAYEINTIRLEQPRIRLVVLNNGKASWDIAKASSDTAATPTDTAQAPFRLKLKKLVISNAYVLYDDRQERTRAEIKGLDHSLSGDLSSDLTRLRTRTLAREVSLSMGGIPYLNRTRFDLKVDMEADLLNSKFTLSDNEFRINDLFLKLDGWLCLPKEGYEMDLKFSAEKTDFKNFLSLIPAIYSKDFDKVEATGRLGFDGFIRGRYNEVSFPAFALNLSVDNGSFRYPDLPRTVNNIFIDASVKNKGGSADNTVIHVKKLHLEMAGNPLDARIMVSTPVSDPNIDAAIKGKLNLGQVREFYPLGEDVNLNGTFAADITLKGRMSYIDRKEYEKFDARGSLRIGDFRYSGKEVAQNVLISEAELLFSPAMLQLTKLSATFGKTDIKAAGKVENYLAYLFRDELLKGSFNLTSGLTDISSFMSSNGEAGTSGPEQDEEMKSDMTVIMLPANIDFELNTAIGRLLYEKMEVTGIRGNVVLRDRSLNMNELSMNLLGGSMVLSGMYTSKNPDAPAIDLSLDGRNLNIPEVIKHIRAANRFASILKHASGNLSVNMKYASSLKKDMTPDYASVNASGGLKTNNITLTNADILNRLSEVLKINMFRSVSAKDVNLSFSIVNGTIFLKPGEIKFSKSTMGIEGTIRLDKTLNLMLKLAIPRSEFGSQANDFLNDLSSKASAGGIPVNIGETVNLDIVVTGTTDKPEFKTGLKGSMENLIDDLKEQAEEEIRNKVEEVKDKARDEANKAIDEAEKRAKQVIAEAEAKAAQLRAEAKAAGDRLIAEAEAAGQKLINEASNPFAKEAAKLTAKKLTDEARNKAVQLDNEAGRKSEELLAKARAEADKIRNDAKNKVNP